MPRIFKNCFTALDSCDSFLLPPRYTHPAPVFPACVQLKPAVLKVLLPFLNLVGHQDTVLVASSAISSSTVMRPSHMTTIRSQCRNRHLGDEHDRNPLLFNWFISYIAQPLPATSIPLRVEPSVSSPPVSSQPGHLPTTFNGRLVACIHIHIGRLDL